MFQFEDQPYARRGADRRKGCHNHQPCRQHYHAQRSHHVHGSHAETNQMGRRAGGRFSAFVRRLKLRRQFRGSTQLRGDLLLAEAVGLFQGKVLLVFAYHVLPIGNVALLQLVLK